MILGTFFSLAQPMAAGQAQRPNMLAALLPFVLVFAIFYLLIIMPQRKKQKKHLDLVENLKPGDRIVTSAGIFGTVMGVQKDRIEVKIAANVKIEITKSAVGVILGATDSGMEKKD
jgi:preprotein translocase subunit YajC